MAPEENDAPKDEGWTDLGDGATRPDDAIDIGDATPEAPGEDALPKAYAGKQPTPPWKTSLTLGVAGLLLMLIVFIFPELRRFSAPWDPSYPIAHFILLVPIFGLVFAAIGLFGKEYAEERGKAIRGLVLGLATIALGIAVITTDPARETDGATVTDERLEMDEQELRNWRIEKLNR